MKNALGGLSLEQPEVVRRARLVFFSVFAPVIIRPVATYVIDKTFPVVLAADVLSSPGENQFFGVRTLAGARYEEAAAKK